MIDTISSLNSYLPSYPPILLSLPFSDSQLLACSHYNRSSHTIGRTTSRLQQSHVTAAKHWGGQKSYGIKSSGQFIGRLTVRNG